MAHHQPIEELKEFRMSSKHVRNFGIMSGLGVVLLVVGLILSNITLPGEKHDDHGAAPAHEQKAPAGHEEHKEHSDAGKLLQFASAQHEATAGHGEAHGEAHEGHHAEESDHLASNGTWRRAVWHADQLPAEHHEREVTTGSKIGMALLMGGYFWLAIALFGTFFIAVGYLANAGWYVAFKRVLEPYYRFLPIGSLAMLAAFFFFGKYIYDWVAIEPGLDALIDGKRALLNSGVILIFGLGLVGVWTGLSHMLRKNSLAEEKEGGVAWHKKSIRLSAIFLLFFGFGFAMFAFVWLMSFDPHWFSTIYAVYCFAGLFLSGVTVTMFITTHLKEKGYLPSLNGEHLHDLGKFMFAFSVFWAYIWISQYLLIWYANIPEETIYYWNRFENYKLLFGLNVAINFLFPFIALMTRKAKRQIDSLRSVGRVMIFGRFLDLYLLIAPGVLGAHGGFAEFLMAAGAVLVFGGIFLFIVFKGFEGAPIEARKHPYYQESINHSTGV
jgi:hypothetical protein